ncbi:substrate-binding domain-containing protein [Mastigocladopsis repens]|uniref:substrate-binding domain-containing protein n=1 Tax=Mastigocladopsis repens TaxID=221287 RepID=UPI0002DFC862|nr:substrate-binding domain-containing protein [Mastigocladopsis repens]
MKLNILEVLATLGMSIALGGLSGCTTNTSSNASTNTPADTQAQPEIKIGGSGSTYPAMKILANAYIAKVQNTKFTFLPPNQSESAIAGVKDGVLEVASISKQLKPEENDGTLQYQETAKDALLVATHPSVKGVTNLTTANLKAIYSGAIKNWKEIGGPDAKIIVLDRPEDESAKRLLRKHYLGKDLKNSQTAVILREENDLMTALQNTPYSIGAFSLAYAISNQLPVNRLNLNGVEPTLENVQAGKYQMVRTIGTISKKTTSLAAQGFIDFAKSEQGAEALRKSGFVPSMQK